MEEVAATNCPGKNFDMAAFRKRLERKPVEKKDYEGHWGETSIKKAVNKKGNDGSSIMGGYPDGNWKPDQTPTRAELATILNRLGLLD